MLNAAMNGIKSYKMEYALEHSVLDLILVGKSGCGKSSLANSILQDEDRFKSSYSTVAVTKIPQFELCKFESRFIQVVDCPGVIETDEGESGNTTMVKDSLTNAMLANPKGYHAFLVVLKFGSRFTKEEQKVLKILKDILGENFLKDFGIIVMTNGDTFKHHQSKEKSLSLKSFCADDQGPFKSILNECNNRIVVFDNITTDSSVKHKQVKDLIDMVDQLGHDGRRYTNEYFKKAEEEYMNVLAKSSTPIVGKTLLEKQSMIMLELKSIEDIESGKEKVDRLIKLKPNIDDLIKDIKKEDKDTGILDLFIKNSNEIKEMIDMQIHEETEDLKLQQMVQAQRLERRKKNAKIFKRINERRIRNQEQANKTFFEKYRNYLLLPGIVTLSCLLAKIIF